MGKIIRDGNIITQTTYIAPKAEPEYVSFNSYKGTTLDLSWLRTDKITSMKSMFSGCSSLTSLDLSNFNTSNITNMEYMFQDCYKLTSLDLSSFDFTNVTSYNNMFNGVPANCEILVKDETAKTWITSKFSNLTNVKVKGGN